MANNLLAIEDRDVRSQQAAMLVELMKQFTQPGIKDNHDFNHKVWDDLHIISNFQLDIDSPFPKPDISVITKKPERIGYSYYNPKFRHLGKNIELLAQSIGKIENEQEKEHGAIYLGRLIKTFHSQYSRETVEDFVIIDQVRTLSNGTIELDLDKIRSENLFENNVFKSNPDREDRSEAGNYKSKNNRNKNNRNKNGKNNQKNMRKRK
jgi:hypothetical protein